MFDLISVDGEFTASDVYADYLANGSKACFGDGTLVHPVETELVSDTSGIEQLFNQMGRRRGCGRPGCTKR